MVSTRLVELVIDTVVCLTLAKWETVSGQFGGYLMTFKPSNSDYNFGRLADPGDIARYGPLSQSPNVRQGNTGDIGDYPPEEVAQMAHSLAVKAITTP